MNGKFFIYSTESFNKVLKNKRKIKLSIENVINGFKIGIGIYSP